MDQTLSRLDDTDVVMLLAVAGSQVGATLRSQGQEGLWLELWRERHPVMLSASHRVGSVPLWSNLYRLTLNKKIQELIVCFSRFADRLVDVSALNFNRDIVVQNREEGAEQMTFSHVILDYLQQSRISVEWLDRSCQELSVWRTNELDDEVFEHAKSLGFTTMSTHGLGFLVEQEATRTVSFALKRFIQSTRVFLHILRQNGLGTSQDLTFLNYLDTRLKLLEECELSMDQGWELLERSRCDVLTGLTQLMKDLDVVHEQLIELLSRPIPQPSGMFLGWQKLEVVKQLMNRGVQVVEAVDATRKLEQYCESHQTTMQSLIPAELAKLDRHFLGKADDLILEVQKAGQQRSVEQKHQALLGLDQMKSYFKTLLPLLLIFLQGCGVKTTPVSESIDYRPILEYRQTPLGGPQDEEP